MNMLFKTSSLARGCYPRRMKTTWVHRVGLLLALSAPLQLAACGDSGGDTEASGGSDSEGETETTNDTTAGPETSSPGRKSSRW